MNLKNMVRVISFDIFDTCLVRKCGKSENLYDLISLHAFNCPVEESIRKEFVYARKIAENKYGTLKDFYKNLDFSNPYLKTPEELVAVEQQVENEILIPVKKTINLIKFYRGRGQILFISDMYLSGEFLQSILCSKGIMQEGDMIFVSGDYGKMKFNGTLFQHIHEKYGINYHHWLHFGANKVSDYSVPRTLGIKCKLIKTPYSYFEKQWQVSPNLNFPYNTLVSGISRAIRLSREDDKDTLLFADLIAPLWVSFVIRILNNAQQNQIKRLYFCSRDAYIHYLIAKKFSKYYSDIELKYLFISQYALYEGNSEARIRYFKQIGLANHSEKVGIVDISTSGHTLVKINEDFCKKGFLPIRGFFFNIYIDGQKKYPANDYYSEINYLHTSTLSRIRPLIKHNYLFEMFFSPHNHKRCIGYTLNKKGNAIPIFQESAYEKQDIKSNIEIINHRVRHLNNKSIILEFAQQYIDCGLVPYTDSIFSNIAIPSLISFFRYPRKEYIQALEGINVYDWSKQTIVPYIEKRNVITLMAPRAKGTAWRKGTLFFSIPLGLSHIILWLYQILNSRNNY